MYENNTPDLYISDTSSNAILSKCLQIRIL
jgi:hypothetical protein